MVEPARSQPELIRIIGNILLVFSALVLPAIEWSLFGWLHALLPLLVFFYLIKFGFHVGNRLIIAGALLAFIVAVPTGLIGPVLFSLSLVPAGYIIAKSGLAGDSPVVAGFKGAVTQAICWTVLLAGVGIVTASSPYGSIVASFSSAIDMALEHYRQNQAISAEMLQMLEQRLGQAKRIFPIILPALFLSCTLFSTWITMVLGNTLANRFCEQRIWPSYRFWRLPGQLIWILIVSVALALLPTGTLRLVAVNLLILLSIVYCFQGFAVCVYFMNKWNVPLLFRSFLYVVIIIQQFGTILLLVLGIADIWVDFRRLDSTSKGSENDTNNE